MNINVPKSMLPDCAVGETVEMKITGEDGESFILSPYADDAEEPAATPKKPAKPKTAKAKRPKAVAKALKRYEAAEAEE